MRMTAEEREQSPINGKGIDSTESSGSSRIVARNEENPFENRTDVNLIPKHNSNRAFRASEGMLILMILLGLCFFFGHVLHRSGFTYLHETGLSIITGIITGTLIRYMYTPVQLDNMIAFQQDIFFLILLPPIIFESGYNMKRKMFFKNIGSLLAFALVGTVISTVVIAMILIIAEAAGAGMGLKPLDTLIFGSLISATDPVSVLAIFKAMEADQNLFANVFGESVLNDAVAIVLYETCVTFVSVDVNAHTIFIAIGFFVLIFFGSFIIGVLFALGCSKLLKHIAFWHSPTMETCMQILFAYESYLLADAMGLSGIVSILFCGIAMAQYTIPNLSIESKELTTRLWGVWAMMTETFVFLYLGLAVFSFGHEHNIGFMLVGLFSIFPARAANVFPISAVVNRTRTVNKIPWNHQIMIWFSGLRGAIAMALSLDVPTKAQPKTFTTTLFIVIVTVFLMGGLTASMLRWLGIDMGPDAGASGENEPDVFLKRFDYGNFFQNFDRKYMKPFFTRPSPPGHTTYGHVDTKEAVHVDHVELNNLEEGEETNTKSIPTVQLDEDNSEGSSLTANGH